MRLKGVDRLYRRHRHLQLQRYKTDQAGDGGMVITDDELLPALFAYPLSTHLSRSPNLFTSTSRTSASYFPHRSPGSTLFTSLNLHKYPFHLPTRTPFLSNTYSLPPHLIPLNFLSLPESFSFYPPHSTQSPLTLSGPPQQPPPPQQNTPNKKIKHSPPPPRFPPPTPHIIPYYTTKWSHDVPQGLVPPNDALSNAPSISASASDPGLRSSFGVNIHDGLDVVEQRAAEFRKIAGKYLK